MPRKSPNRPERTKRSRSDVGRNARMIANRSGSNYNPGGHRGRSGQNGAGNHRKTAEEKAISAAADAEVKEAKRAAQREIAAQKRFDTNMAKLDSNIASMNVKTLGSRRTVLTRSNWNEKPLRLKCRTCGVAFDKYPSEIIHYRGKNLCGTCTTKSHGTPRADARLKFEMKCDEQGLELVWFASMGEMCDVKDRRTGEVHSIWPKHIERWGCRPVDDRTVQFVADEHDHVFAFCGTTPTVLHPFITDLLANNPVEGLEKPRKGHKALKEFIDECREAGDKVVNFSGNKSWEKEGMYTWGEIPTSAALGKYFEDMRERWQ